MATTAEQVDFLLAGYRTPDTDEVLIGGKVYSYIDGTTTLSALWTDADKGGTATNPVILDATGKAEVYGDLVYKFRIYTSEDVFVEEITGLEYRVTGVALEAADPEEAKAFVDQEKYLTPYGLGLVIADASQRGISRFGTQAEVSSGTLGNVMLSPGTHKGYHDSEISGTSVGTIEELRQIDVEQGKTAYVLGYRAIGDGGGGPTRYGVTGAPVGTYVENGGSVILPDGGDGSSAYLFENNRIDLREFGAINDGTTDALSAIQSLVDYLNSIGGGVITGTGSYALSSRFILKSDVFIEGTNLELKAMPDNANVSGKLIGVVAGTENWGWSGCILDGNVTNNPHLWPLYQVFSSTDGTIRNNIMRNNAGMGGNYSTSLSGIDTSFNLFENIGYTTGVGGDDAKQGIAYSGTGHSNITICDNKFYKLGLDCISISEFDGGTVERNIDLGDCYSLLYSGGGINSNIRISKNEAHTAQNVGGSTRPEGLGFDLPKLIDAVVSGNISTNCSAGGIGIFAGCKGVSVFGNVCKDNNQSAGPQYQAGITIKGDGTTGCQDITLSGNIVTDRQAVPTMLYGVIYDPYQVDNISIDGSNLFGGTTTHSIAQVQYTTPIDPGTLVGSVAPDVTNLMPELP
ncbi:MAG: right-handed parallel beta-helix repeat-containing protein [Planctomycetes bacterium]|nr:right-handed parallel beta-helix repeat-containing protein [Planctomycetota bacterium]